MRLSSVLLHALAVGATTWLFAFGCGSASGTSEFTPKGGDGGTPPGSSGFVPTGPDGAVCEKKTCSDLGWACGYTVDACGNVTNCADEGRACGPSEVCVGGLGAPTTCVANPAGGVTCDVCDALPDCTGKPQKTKLTGRVVTPGRTDGDTANQVGVPNAIVYITQSSDPAELPAVPVGVPSGSLSCDRCADQDLGRVLAGAITDATGTFTIEGDIPVGKDFLLVVRAGRFRRAVKQSIPAASACQTTTLASALPANPTRIPRSMTDGLAVNIPKIAITTGQIDAMECVFDKLGIADAEFGNPGAAGAAAPRIHLYRGGPVATPRGAYIDGSTPHDAALYGDAARLALYDLLVADCEGLDWDSTFAERDASGANVREYLNRGGRMFASHLGFTWLSGNGSQPYAAATPLATGLDQAATWTTTLNNDSTGTGRISLGRPQASPRIQGFADWAIREALVPATPPLNFTITQPRSQNISAGAATEEFVYLTDANQRVQQFSFNTPYGAPAAAACGRVAYSGFHVVAGSGSSPYADVVFPAHCAGDLSSQEKVLLYMLFDVAACVGSDPLPPKCVPATCASIGAGCGFAPDGCGKLLDCGPCPTPK